MINHGNAQKTPYARALNRFTEGKIQDALQITGKALPCHVTAVSGSIVTVKFDIIDNAFTLPDVTCPMFGPEWIRYPTKVGSLGVVLSADYYLGGVSGLGGSTAKLSIPANLSALVFFPIANNGTLTGNNAAQNWPATENANATVIYGPDGVIIRTVAMNTKMTLSPAGIVLETDQTVDVTADDVVTIEGEGETLEIGNGAVSASGVLKAGNGTSGTITFSGHTITVAHGIVTVLA